MRISAALPPGVTALLFEEAAARRGLEERLVERLVAAGYGEVILPVVDYHEPYDGLGGPSRRGELYRFIDRDGEQLSLRADFTPMLARLLAPRLASLDLPLRLFYRGDVVRYDDDRAGRWREQYQLGAELLDAAGEGAGSAASDRTAPERTALELFLTLLTAAIPSPSGGASGGAPGELPVRVVLGFAGALDEPLAAARERGMAPRRLAAALERRERRAAREAGGVLPEVVERGAPRDPAELGAAGERLVGLLVLRDELAERFPAVELFVDLAEFARATLDPGLFAGAEPDYYDGLVFRAFAGRAARAVGGGGRYDRLFARLGAEVAAAGFSLGLDPLVRAGAGGGAA